MSVLNVRRPPDIGLSHLVAFYQAARLLNFSRAALALGSDQPSISRRVKDLERLVGQQLFNRGPRGVTLTAAGGRLLELSAGPVEALLRLPSLFAEDMAAAPAIEVRVIGGQQLLLSLLGPALLSFQGQYPEVKVSIVNALKPEVIEALRSGRAEIGLTSAAQIPADLQYDELINNELRLLLPARHRWAGRDDVPLSDLASETMLLPESHSTTRQLIVAAFRDAVVSLQAGMELQRWEVIREFVALGAGIAIAPTFVATGHAGVTTAGVAVRFPSRSYGVLTARTQHLSGAARALINSMRMALLAA